MAQTEQRDYRAIGSKGGQASAIARKQAILANAARTEIVDRTVAGLDDQEIGTKLLQSAVDLATAAARGPIPDAESALERKQLADAAKVVHYMARLQLGESTSNVAHASVEDAAAKRAELDARLAAIREGETPASPTAT